MAGNWDIVENHFDDWDRLVILGGNFNDADFLGLTVILLALVHSTVVHSVTHDLFFHAK